MIKEVYASVKNVNLQNLIVPGITIRRCAMTLTTSVQERIVVNLLNQLATLEPLCVNAKNVRLPHLTVLGTGKRKCVTILTIYARERTAVNLLNK
jgi:hypothetical protein